MVSAGYSVPHSISSIARDAKKIHPYVVSLQESIKTFNSVVEKIAENEPVKDLVAGWILSIQGLIMKGIELRWEYFVNTVCHLMFL